MAEANAGEVRARLILDSSQFQSRMEEARSEMQSFADGGKTMAKDLAVIETAAMGLGGSVVAVVSASVVAAANFEQSMSRVSAMSGATEAQYEALEAAAMQYGATTQYSSTQAADALTMLSMAGFSVEESITALPSVLGLAAAGGLELAQASEIAGNVMNGFGLSAADLGHTVDVLAKAANTSNSGVDSLGESMKYVAPVAQALGYNIEDTTAAIALMSNAGIVGGEAGTALRAALLSLNNPVGQAEEAMEALGLKVKDANGNLLPMPQLVGEVAESMEGMTESQKTMYAAQLVGTEAASGFLAILAEGEVGLANYSTELRNSTGAAEEMAAKMHDNIIGAWEEFTGALEAVGIKLGSEFLPVFTAAVRKATDFVDILGELDPALFATAAKVGGTTAAVALLGVGVMRAVTALGKLRLAFITNPVGLAITGIALLAGAFVGLKSAQEEASKVSLTHFNELDKQQKTLKGTIDAFDELKNKSNLTTDEMLHYMSVQKELQDTTDPTKIEELSKVMGYLEEKSGLSKDELAKLIGLNADLIEQAPNTEVAINKSGQAFADSTVQARKLNEALIEQKRIELELQEAKLVANSTKHITEYQSSVEQTNDALQKRNDKLIEIAGTEYNIEQLNQRKKEAMKLQGDERDRALLVLDNELGLQGQELQIQNESYAKLQGKYVERRKEQQAATDVLNKDKEIYTAINQNLLAAAGLTAERGKEKAAVDSAIKSETAKKDAIIKSAGGVGKLTAEQQKSIKEINTTISKYQEAGRGIADNTEKQKGTNKKIQEGKADAEKMTTELKKGATKNIKFSGDGMTKAQQITNELGKPVSKKVTIWETVKKTVSGWFSGGKENRHSGGTFTPQKFHVGGSPAFSKPKVDEVDARLLENEMVLTGAQQANLFNMIRTFNAAALGNMRNQTQGGTQQANNTTINVESLVIREEADIKRVAQELDKLTKQRQRARGAI